MKWLAPRAAAFGAVLATCTSFASGCGGTTITHGGDGVDSRDGGGGSGGIRYGNGGGSVVTKNHCGNGVIDPGEDCDGKALGGTTCQLAGMGMFTSGTLRCNQYCVFDTTSCFTAYGSGGYQGTGGVRYTGGSPSYGGATWVEGGIPVTTCPGGSAPDPSNPSYCSYSDGGTSACDTWTRSQLPYALPNGPLCGVNNCGCMACPTELSNCLADPACAAIERCTLASGCYDNTSCQSSCYSVVQGNGGPYGAAFTKAVTFDKCWEYANCSLYCAIDGGIGVDAAAAQRGAARTTP